MTACTGNALLASAAIFEALAEVDIKFVKIIEKEYDTISIELKKAFKKMVVCLLSRFFMLQVLRTSTYNRKERGKDA